MLSDRLISKFTFHTPDEAGTEKMRDIRRQIRVLAERIDVLCPEGREKDDAVAALQVVMMKANSAIVQQYPLDPKDV